ncbi:uncharacterized protein L969DRAFT_92599 [Mixia osmundae IAM 14324]|uniref:Alpha-ketoglutarate-dependent dioxygenase AlkB-like domain-containing protein n=1 Tax=Mixia osmundae (strain CBS 9802 / IAM 14324 / JCM 22182 / KY 12970) TaxID=764103 RepID=G7DY07_MIXOS|nr:uncharacterized protein L969DRAFT_92599 [Mixia osmundae IAM 14324]KEI41367.1 hypothetical protein L969DRAFT_92599 [Mixia osmundae IAM 14324]GAA95467.1 hypothetical protein E5Q_02121 [Mixia osmundae IAM 14324]
MHPNISSLFLPKECYGFHSGHFDGVISGYRETTVSRFDDPFDANERTTLLAVLKKIYVALGASDESVGFEPPTHLLMHLLHLSSSGRIDPHVDNIEASGGLLAGLSLGSERVMHLERSKDDAFSVLLPPGSLYIQRGTVRFDYKHSIPAEDTWQSRLAGGQQRYNIHP